MDYPYWARLALQRLSETWPLKITVGTLLALCHMHATLLTLFILVITLDLLAKWIALAHRYLETIHAHKKDLWTCFMAIPATREAGLISSDLMKRLFCGKMLIYLIIILGSGLVDEMITIVGGERLFVPLAVGYLATSELISIIENLEEAGVTGLTGLITHIKEKNK